MRHLVTRYVAVPALTAAFALACASVDNDAATVTEPGSSVSVTQPIDAPQDVPVAAPAPLATPAPLELDAGTHIWAATLWPQLNGAALGYTSTPNAAGPDTVFGQLSGNGFLWSGVDHEVSALAVNIERDDANDWGVMAEFSPALDPDDSGRLALRVGSMWLNLADSRSQSGRLFWYLPGPDLAAGGDVEVGLLEFAGSFEPRSVDGYGNNATRPDWGNANAALVRKTPVTLQYATTGDLRDGLPNPRHISNLVFNQLESRPNRYDASDMLWQWGQFIDHDLTFVLEGESLEPMPIPVPKGDVVFDPEGHGDHTIRFIRSAFHPFTGTGADNPRQQLNSITAFIDASTVYGSDLRRAVTLRAPGNSGRLDTSAAGGMLPLNKYALPNIGGDDRGDLFVGGDLRANEQAGLTSMHTLWLREHNRLASQIADANPALSGHEVFEVTRKIVGAQVQSIAYFEFLAMLLGPDTLGEYSGYDPAVDPGLANEFSAGAYRLGHSLLSSSLMHVGSNGEERAVSLLEAFFNPGFVKENDIDGLLLGLTRQRSQDLDAKIIGEVRNLLFSDPPGSGGRDLAALNIQRGRDHGLGSFNAVRQAYGLAPATSFADVSSDPAVQASLAAAYGDIDRLELWPGGIAEDHVAGAMVGETFQTILVDQFRRLRAGDRFWFENDPFFVDHPDLLAEIRSTTLADVIRRNTRLDDEVADDVFTVPAGI